MSRVVDYRTSDFDRRAHRSSLALDLQRIALPSDSLDVIISAHVLEHVPDTDAALAEIFRVLAPGGDLMLQVPLLQAITAPPDTPEFHNDRTPVYWRFGLDLTGRLSDHGFDTAMLVPQPLRARVQERRWHDSEPGSEVDVRALAETADPAGLTALADEETAEVSGFVPDYMFAAWHAHKPSTRRAGKGPPRNP